MAIVYEKTKMLTDKPLHYCPGCTHGIIHRLVAEAIDELGLQDKAIGIAPAVSYTHLTLPTILLV